MPAADAGKDRSLLQGRLRVLWVFVIIGLLTSGAALYRLVAALRTTRSAAVVESGVMILIVVAWITGHTTAIGWIALLGAFGIELLRRASVPHASRDAPDLAPLPTGNAIESPVPSPSPAASPDSELRTAVSGPDLQSSTHNRQSFTTIALLRGPWEAAGGVFLASLRRIGQRDAELIHDQPTSAQIELRVGPTTLELVSVSSSVARAQLDYATAQSWDWPQAAETIAGHAAHVAITTQSPTETPPADTVRLHHRAHAALTEFTPVLAILWPDAGRLVPAAVLTELCQRANDDPLSAYSCVSFRVFPPEGPDAGGFVSDTVGLHAFGLPDIQIVTDGEPDERVSAIVYELADRFFTAGCSLKDGEELCLDAQTNWRVEWRQARFPPERSVIQLTPA